MVIWLSEVTLWLNSDSVESHITNFSYPVYPGSYPFHPCQLSNCTHTVTMLSNVQLQIWRGHGHEVFCQPGVSGCCHCLTLTHWLRAPSCPSYLLAVSFKYTVKANLARVTGGNLHFTQYAFLKTSQEHSNLCSPFLSSLCQASSVLVSRPAWPILMPYFRLEF